MNEVVFIKNEEKSQQMAAYMKNLFAFAGVPAPTRLAMEKELLKASKKLSFVELFELVHFYYAKSEREYQYVAIDLATVNVKRMSLEEVLQFKPLVIEKAWWDSGDAWRKFFALWGASHFEEMPRLFAAFYGEESF
ncbi:hypothetical protein GCM10011573_22070 [Enterococcus wangshanyuanii]|uniref:Globin n=1 Tax=Enterococcus wangshanyuanii TaxID=2005703 RepID=A0ABQ1P6G7_9ENTE|nr:hypothetical protein GCM10011573_22070 [Enterococcus wangshanyuanii]